MIFANASQQVLSSRRYCRYNEMSAIAADACDWMCIHRGLSSLSSCEPLRANCKPNGYESKLFQLHAHATYFHSKQNATSHANIQISSIGSDLLTRR